MPSRDAFDELSALAPLFRVRPQLERLCQFGAQWASPHDQQPIGWMPFHLVAKGNCVLDAVGHTPVSLSAGDIVLLPQGDRHVMRAPVTPTAAPSGSAVVIRPNGAIDVASNSDSPETELICGRLSFEQGMENLAQAALPSIILIRAGDDPSVARLSELLRTIRDELVQAEPGARAIGTNLASALMIMVLRIHFDRNGAREGILGLLSQRHTAGAVLAMIQEPTKLWSLDDLARAANTSRATLVRSFKSLVKKAPLAFLADLRLELAKYRLATSNQCLTDIALDVGYQSQSALTRAFRRRFDLTPTEFRKGRA
ncbi:MAG: AraC family transcriptional regulator [Xanthobacteraceae bacterium]|nr:AraC family transcriptional regulator [Xanthobacteraceae bacterium]